MEVVAAEAREPTVVLAQNNAELRATGGIPTAWATLTVDTGKISMSTFRRSASEWSVQPG